MKVTYSTTQPLPIFRPEVSLLLLLFIIIITTAPLEFLEHAFVLPNKINIQRICEITIKKSKKKKGIGMNLITRCSL